jgi:hypothetical protein
MTTICTSYYFIDVSKNTVHDIRIYLLNSCVYSEGNKIVIAISSELESYENITRIAEIGRPKYLIILGILSFVTDKVFSVFSPMKNSYVVGDLPYKDDKMKFIYEDENYSEQVRNIKETLKNMKINSQELIFSALDRWRKARYMEQESENNYLYNDELYIAFFHVIELLAEEYKNKVDKQCEILTEKYINDIFDTLFIKERDKLNTNKQLIKEIMYSPLSVATKIKKMLSTFQLKTDKVSTLITTLIKERNNVAHGISAFQNKVLFPLPPFFPLVKNREKFQFILVKTLSARVIDKHLGSDLWKDKWKNLQRNLPPTATKIKERIKLIVNQTNDININDFTKVGTPETIYYYVLQKKISIQEIEDFFTRFIDLNFNSKIIERLLPLLIILLESKKEKIALKSELLIIELLNQNKISKSDVRDLMYEIEYLLDKPKIEKIKKILRE